MGSPIRDDTKLRTQLFEQAKNQWRNCIENSTNKSECTPLRVELKVKAKEALQSGIQNAIQVMEQTKERIMADTTIPLEQRNMITAKIQERIEHLNLVQERVYGLSNTSNETDINDAVREAKEKWLQAKKEVIEARGKFNNEKAGVIITKMERLSDRLGTIIQKYAEKGVDTSSISDLKVQFDAKVAEAKTHYEAAKEIWNMENRTPDDTKKANDEMRLGIQSLKEAHNILKEINLALRDILRANQNSGNTNNRENESE
jgi:hypothetical protein